MSTLYRQWLMIRLIPRYPAKIDTATIQQRLGEFGYLISRRTIQRDLKNLADGKIFPLVYDDSSNPIGWSWAKDGKEMDIPSMGPYLALTLVLAEHYLKLILPLAAKSVMAVYFKQARKVLAALPDGGFRRWPDLVIMAEHRELNADVVEIICRALFEGRSIALRYKGDNGEQTDYSDLIPGSLRFSEGMCVLKAKNALNDLELCIDRIVESSVCISSR